MKKILFILMLCVSLIACNKHSDDIVETTPTVTISFDQQLVSSNSMVRSTTNEFLDIIEEQTPKYVIVTLKNLDLDKTFTCKSNETITIPIGNYEISGIYNSSSSSFGNTGNNIYRAPCLFCDRFNINITSNNTITLNVYYNCYAIFALIDECESCVAKYGSNQGSLLKYNKYFYGYFKNEHDYSIIITPYADSTEFITTTYNFSTIYDVNKVFAEYGKYYVIHPQKVDKTTSSFEVNFTDMEEGEI